MKPLALLIFFVLAISLMGVGESMYFSEEEKKLIMISSVILVSSAVYLIVKSLGVL